MSKNLFLRFSATTANDINEVSQKGVNVALLATMTNRIVQQYNISSPWPLIGLEGGTLTGSVYRSHLQDNGLEPKLVDLNGLFNNNQLPQKDFHQQAHALILNAPFTAEVEELIVNEDAWLRAYYKEKFGIDDMSIFWRSAKDRGEDEQNKAGATAGAGIGESIDENFSNTDSLNAAKRVMASSYSFQACGAMKGRKSESGTWEMCDANMCVVYMPQVFSEGYGSALVFGDITGDFIRVSFASKKKGEALVASGDDFEEYHVLKSKLQSDDASDSIIYLSHPADETKRQVVIALAKFAAALQDEHGFTIDMEWAIGALNRKPGAQVYLVPVQFRSHTATEEAKKVSTQILYEVKEQPSIAPCMIGTSVGNMCAVGEVIFVHHEADIMRIDPTGKIVVMDEPYPSATGLLSNPELRGFIAPGTPFAHLFLNSEGIVTSLAGVEILSHVKNGDIVTILDNKVYIGDHSDKYEEMHVDLRDLAKLRGTKAGVVFGKPTQIKRIYPLFEHGVVKEVSLARAEELGWDAMLPSPLNWIYYNNIQNNEKGKEVKAIIDKIMAAYNTTDPIEAYVKVMAAKSAPLVALCKKFNAMCNIRCYGGRIDEDKVYLDNVLPADIVPHEQQKMIGYNGMAMYMTPWGEKTLDVSLMIIKKLGEWGYTNVPVFIPNVATPVGFEELLLPKIKQYGLEDRELHIMNETGVTHWFVNMPYEDIITGEKAPSFFELGVVKASNGFNDRKHQSGRDARNHIFTDGAANMNNNGWYNQVLMETTEQKALGWQVGSCGRPAPGVMKAMIKGGADVIGLPFGKQLIDGINLIHKTQQELELELSTV